MEIKQFRYGDTNLAYLIYSGGEAAAIDGGAPEEILDFIKTQNLRLKYVLNTHEHHDHTPGNERLLKINSVEFIAPAGLVKMKQFHLGDESVEVFATPGHTEDSIVFKHSGWLITGDTLFNGTVGNCYSGDYETYFNSLEKVLSFPPGTKIFAGHDIVDYSLGVAKKIDPENQFLSLYRSKYDKNLVVSTLEMELKVNPFIRFNDSKLDAYRSGLKMSLDTPYLRWRAMMSVH
ncbi:MAG: MBL fold metallo-hydrolase [Spirochaetales bacterium]|nr:MBL fold metallo-hydrolase [Spirochaetales bacterium]